MLAFDPDRFNNVQADLDAWAIPAKDNVTPLKTPGPTLILHAIVVTLLSVVTLLAYQGIQSNGFHFDDWHNILLNPALQLDRLTLRGLFDAAGGASLPHRPFASITFAIDWWRGGDGPAHFLATNLAVHIVAGIAVFAFLFEAIQSDGDAQAPVTVIAAAGLASAWWLVQPVHVQAVSYVVQRMTELAALFSVLSVWAYIRGHTAPRRRLAWWGLSVLLFIPGALSKQNAWITPVLVLMAEFLVLRNRGELVRSRLDRWLLGLPAAGALLGVVALLVDGPVSQWILRGYEWRDFTLAERLLTQPKVVLFHMSQILWPLPDRFSLEHNVEVVRSAASWHFWLPLAVIAASTTAGAWLAFRRGTRIAGFFVLWIPVTLLIESTFIPLELIFEHRMYLPSVGIAGLIAVALTRSARHKQSLRLLPWAGTIVAILVAMWSTSEHLPHWRTEIALLENSTRHAPNSVRVWNQLGVEYLEHGQLDRARQAIERANAIEPRWGDGYPFVNRGVVLEAMGRIDDAMAVYEETIRIFPRQELGYNNRGLLHLRAGKTDLALQDFDRAIAVKPEYAPAWTNRGTARYFMGDSLTALGDFEKATALSPRERIAFHYQARIYQSLGRDDEAAAARSRACRLGIAGDCTP